MKIEGWHIVIIIVLAIVLFGAPKLPGLARSVGQSLRIFKSEVKQMKDENNTGEPSPGPVEGRVVHQAPQHQGDGYVEGQSQAGTSRQSGTPHSNP